MRVVLNNAHHVLWREGGGEYNVPSFAMHECHVGVGMEWLMEKACIQESSTCPMAPKTKYATQPTKHPITIP